jgi:hypothetical protein
LSCADIALDKSFAVTSTIQISCRSTSPLEVRIMHRLLAFTITLLLAIGFAMTKEWAGSAPSASADKPPAHTDS